MASIILGNTGEKLGENLVGGFFAPTIGRYFGSFLGSAIDKQLFSGSDTSVAGISYINHQSATYGNVIPEIYGTVRIAGNIIWSTAIKVRREIDQNAGGKFSSNIKYNEPTYTVSMAIALCSGKIQKIERIWADDLLLNQNNYNIRFYLGTEDQMPDPMIESLEGIGKTPAYRGLSYIVFDNINLGEFGNKIPNFTFEVSRNIEKAEEIVEDMIESIVIIPGSGEFVYDTQIQNKMQGSKNSGIWVPHGYISSVNQHNNSNHSNSILSLNQLKQTLPNIQWVAPVVNWFATSLNIADSKILPGVEFHDSGIISPDEWEVAGFKRKNALLVPSKDNKPIYGGTPNDLGVIRYLEEMKKRGYKIMLYPMPLVAEKGKPWRGRMYGNASEVQKFFTKKGGYNEFILHYAKLAKGKIDAFLIGSELVSITKIADQHNNFPAVDELVNLASMVRKILGNGVKISYAADWSEYHHTDGGWYHLDKLWASYDIDFIGIDAYFPITDSDQSEYDPKEIKRGWDMGEGYDFYFSDENRNIKKPLTPQYAGKNIEWWWENPHTDPNGKQTNWIPKSKKIWFTEYGFPSVDCASNQPNVFFDSKSNESRFPKYSKGNVDIMAQRIGIQGTEERWKNSRCVERKFLWCWDARPYPFWPSLRSVWDDVDCWSRGHWIQGKIAKTLLSDVLGFLCSKAGLAKDDYDTSRIHSYVDGLYISARTSIRKIIDILQSIYFFDTVEKEGKIHFIPRYSKKPIQIKESELIIRVENNAQDACDIKRLQETDLPYSVDINFLNKSRQYSVCNQHATRSSVTTKKSITIDLPSVLNEYEAFHIAKTTLYNFWLECLRYSFVLPMRYMFISPSDVITLEFCNRMHCIRVTSVEIGRNGIVKILGVSENLDIYKNDNYSIDVEDQHVDLNLGTHLEILDIPTLPQETGDYSNARVLIAACGMSNNWSGCNISYAEELDDVFQSMIDIRSAATMGATVEILGEASQYITDNQNSVAVSLLHGHLYSITLQELLNNGNLALIGDEIIQFQTAELVSENCYRLSNLLCGRFGTEHKIKNHSIGERFILLDSNVETFNMPHFTIGQSFKIKTSTLGRNANIHDDFTKHINYNAENLKPLSPVLFSKNYLDNGIEIRWIRRTRINGAWRNNVEVPLCETECKYLVNISKGNKLVMEHVTKSEVLFIPYIDVGIKDRKELNYSNEYLVRIAQFSGVLGVGEQLSIRI